MQLGNGNIKAITFDLWNTLIVDDHDGGKARSARRIQATHEALLTDNRRIPRGQVEEAYWLSLRRFEEVRNQGLDTPFYEQIDIFLGLIEDGLDKVISPQVRKKIMDHHANAFLQAPPALMDGVHETLDALSHLGYSLGLICNSGITPGSVQRRFLSGLGVSNHFRVLTFSDEERLAKPSAGIFLSTLEALGAKPYQALHVGDRPETDILGAKALGMKAVLIGNAPLDGLPVTPDARIRQLPELLDILTELRERV